MVLEVVSTKCTYHLTNPRSVESHLLFKVFLVLLKKQNKVCSRGLITILTSVTNKKKKEDKCKPYVITPRTMKNYESHPLNQITKLAKTIHPIVQYVTFKLNRICKCINQRKFQSIWL